MPTRHVHVVLGGPVVNDRHHIVSNNGHDMEYVRARLMDKLQEASGKQRLLVTTSNDYSDIAKWLKPGKGASLLVSYTAGPYPSKEQDASLQQWLGSGGRWLALHASNAAFFRGKFQHADFAATVGTSFITHPPLHSFPVKVVDPAHPITRGLPPTFEAFDELYINKPHAGVDMSPLLTATDTKTKPGVSKEHVIAYTRTLGKGCVAYVGLGHAHSKWEKNREVKGACVGPWESPTFNSLLANSIEWGLAGAAAPVAAKM